jgi:hypothetical protein
MTIVAMGTWEVAGDDDWFGVTLTGGQSYRLEMNGAGSVQWLPSLVPPERYGEGLASYYNASNITYGHFTPTTSGIYYFSASGFSVGSYSITLKPVVDDYADNLNSTGIFQNGLAHGKLEHEGDVDVFKTQMVAGQTYQLNLDQGDIGYISLRDADGHQLALEYRTDADGQSLYYFTAVESGTYNVEVSASSTPSSIYTPNPVPRDYTLNVTSVTVVDDFAGNSSTAGSIDLVRQGNVWKGEASGQWERAEDDDWFAIDLVAGQTYDIVAGKTTSEFAEILLTVADSDGDIAQQSWGYVSQHHRGFTANESGTYYISARGRGAWQQEWSAPATYKISVTTVADDYSSNPIRAGRLEVGQAGGGQWEVNYDDDWFAIDLIGGQSYVLTGTGAGGLFNFKDGQDLSALPLGNAFTAAVSGTYYVSAEGRRSDNGALSSYQLTVQTYQDDHVDNVRTTGTISVGSSVSGVAEVVYDTDWFAVTLEAGKSYVVTTTGSSSYVAIYDQNGARTGTPGRTFTPDATGTYYLANTSGTAGNYSLKITSYNDDFVGNADTSGRFFEATDDGITRTGTGKDDTLIGSAKGDTLIGGGGHDRLFAGSGNDRLNGDAGNDRLTGGLGGDWMVGGTGNDTYVVDNFGDTVIERANQGIDTVESSIHYTLGAHVERLRLTGAAHIRGTGNALDNILFGNDGNNVLDGRGGADTMVGGLGNDTYVVDNARDVVIEVVGAGTDVVEASISYKLGDHVERLRLTGSADINGIGNALDNRIFGNDGDNVLNGGAGADMLYGRLGADILMGGAGRDGFVFDTALRGGNTDRIADFSVTDDSIYLDRAIFTRAGAVGVLAIGAFVTGPRALDPADRIVYNSTTGALYYDADGNGAGAAIQFATVTPGLALTSNDFILI